MAAKRKKPLPATPQPGLTAAELAQIVQAVSRAVVPSDNDLAAAVTAINTNVYFGVASHHLKPERMKILDAAETLLEYLRDGYPMETQLADLHRTLEAAIPFLLPTGWQPRGEAYWAPAIQVHVFSCWFCLKAGLDAGMSRDSVAVRITVAILRRFGHIVTEGALEAFFQKVNLGARLRPELEGLQNATRPTL